MKKLVLVVFAGLFLSDMYGQEVGIGSQANVTDCGFFLMDSGLSSQDYSPNEDLVTTICADGTGENFVNLYFTYSNIAAGDFLRFFIGTEASEENFMAEYTGSSLSGQNITSPGPCITVQFVSNGDANVGSFAAVVNCETPCARPIVAVSSSETVRNPSLICPGESITLDGSPTQFFNNMAIESWTWDFGDGETDNSSWPTVSHSYDEPGAYIVQLYVADENGCESANLISETIFVATEPVINVSISDPLVCTGQEVELSASAVPVTWDAIPDANFGEALFIPDDQNGCFSSGLTFTAFSPGATLTDVNNLEAININFEHSFMGDLVISIICPDGTSVVLHQQGGGGTFLGEPIDNDGNLNPGVGYDYAWSPSATNGTWAENSGGTLPSGTYESVNSLGGLVGCPLNGEWSIEVCDLWASDNGFIFGWSIDFDPSLFPDLISFTPSIGMGCDSTYWSGGNFATQDEGCDLVTIIPNNTGIFNYTYTVKDNHGCTYTAQQSLEVYPGPIPSAGEDIVFCGQPVAISGSVTNPVQGVSYTYSWGPSSNVSNPNSANTQVQGLAETTDIVLSVYPTTDPQCLVRDTLVAVVPETPISWPLDTLYFCPEFEGMIGPPEYFPTYDYSWSYSPNLIDEPELFQEAVFMNPTEVGYYYLTMTEPLCGLFSVTPYLIQTKPCQIRIPNVFSPNGDQYNNFLEIEGLEDFVGSTIKVFNRWGTMVYESDDYRNNWSPAEEEAPAGVYYVILGVKTNKGMDYYDMHMTLLR